MAKSIKKGVGKGGKNAPDDVQIVQELLAKLGYKLGKTGPKKNGVDGAYGDDTLAAILAYQKKIGFAKPDGRVDPDGRTWKALSAGAKDAKSAAVEAPDDEKKGGDKKKADDKKSDGSGEKASGWDVEKAVKKLNSQAKSKPQSQCAKFTRIAIEAGGVTLGRTNSAKDYGSKLVKAGFKAAGAGGYKAGDVAVMQSFTDKTGTDHPHGHMQMYNGSKWVSDFVQRDFWPGPAYRESKPSFTIYRFE